MKAYRLEHKRLKAGPYQFLNHGPSLSEKNDWQAAIELIEEIEQLSWQLHNDRRPMPQYDGFSVFTASRYLYGFKDLDQLIAWFGEQAIELLEMAGFHLVEREVDPILVEYGTRQIRWLKD